MLKVSVCEFGGRVGEQYFCTVRPYSKAPLLLLPQLRQSSQRDLLLQAAHPGPHPLASEDPNGRYRFLGPKNHVN